MVIGGAAETSSRVLMNPVFSFHVALPKVRETRWQKTLPLIPLSEGGRILRGLPRGEARVLGLGSVIPRYCGGENDKPTWKYWLRRRSVGATLFRVARWCSKLDVQCATS